MHIKKTIIMTLILWLFTKSAAADVYLNGHYIPPSQIPILENAGIGNGKIVSGHYWVDLETGIWGYGDYYDPSFGTENTTPSYYEDRVAESIAGMGYSIPTPSTAFTPGSSFTYDY